MANVPHRVGARGRRVVRLWYGKHCISELKAAADLAERMAGAWHRRFPGLRITNDPAELAPAGRQ